MTLSLQDLLRLHGESSLAVLLMLLAVVSVLPVAGAGTVMSLGIWVVAWSWVRARENGLALVLSTAAGLAGVAYGVSMAHLTVHAFGRMMEMDPMRWLNNWL